MTRNLFSVLILLISSTVFAEPPTDGDGTPPRALYDNAGRACNRDKSEVSDVNSLIANIESGKQKARSVDDFLGLLPEKIRKAMLFTADSKSIQESDVAHPRVILKSPNSEVTLSFSTGKGLRGSDAVELQVWDAKERRFNMTEIRFPEDTDDRKLQGEANAKVVRNPGKCVTCHGGGENSQQTPRPVFDPYRQWAGFVPFSEDRLAKGSPEVAWYKSYLNQVESGAPRMRQLKPLITSAQIDAALEHSPTVPIPSTQSWSTQEYNTPALDMSHQFLVLNGCRVVGDLKRDPNRWNAIKYALAGGLLEGRCPDPTIFLNPEQNENAANWYRARGVGRSDGAFDFKSVVADTKKRQNQLSSTRESNELWFLEKNLGTAADAEKTVDLIDRTNIRGRGRSGPNSKGYTIDDPMVTSRSRFPTFENHYDEISKTRYLLDPLGIQTNLWSMAVDPESYAHVEFFEEITKQPEIAEVLREADGDCNKLAKLSREALKDTPPDPLALDRETEPFCAAPDLEQRAITDLRRYSGPIGEGAIATAAAKAFGTCVECHTYGLVEGAPPLPFGDLTALKKLISKRKGKVDDFGEIIWDRITRAPDAYNAMPLGGHLSNDSKTAIRMWLNSIK